MCDLDSDFGELVTCRTVKARKPHSCSCCKETIAARERYKRIEGKWDGEFACYKQCARCHRIFEALAVKMPGEPVDLLLNCGEVWEDPPDDIAALAFVKQGEISVLKGKP